jgi:uncharacterized membrane protein (UPF0136 family)
MASGYYYDEDAGRYLLLAYALLILFGGLFAYYKVKSRVSLITSVVSAVALFVAFGISWAYPVIAFAIGAIVSINLAINFAFRLQASRKFMPAGMLMILSTGVFIFLCILAARAPIDGLPPYNGGKKKIATPVAALMVGEGGGRVGGGGKVEVGASAVGLARGLLRRPKGVVAPAAASGGKKLEGGGSSGGKRRP